MGGGEWGVEWCSGEWCFVVGCGGYHVVQYGLVWCVWSCIMWCTVV